MHHQNDRQDARAAAAVRHMIMGFRETQLIYAAAKLGIADVLYGDEWLWHAYGSTLYSITTGLPAFDLVHGQPLFEYLQPHPEAASTFNQAMTGYSELESAAVSPHTTSLTPRS